MFTCFLGRGIMKKNETEGQEMKTRILASVLACVPVLHDLPKAQMEIVMAVLDSLRAGAEVSGYSAN